MIVERRLELPNLQASEKLGRLLSFHLNQGHLLTLRGELGVGKTTLARSIITTRLLEEGRSEAIPSPTFSLLQVYETRSLILSHADLFRIDRESALQELDLDGALEAGALLVEWPRYLEKRISPTAKLEVLLYYGPAIEKNSEARRLVLIGTGIWADKLNDANAGPLSSMIDFLL